METLVTDNDVELLLADMLELYGYDFTEYSKASLKRRIQRIFINGKFSSFAALRYRIQTDKDYFNHAVTEITVNVTEMFRDPSFYRAIRETVIPVLATHPFIRIWHAGCATGEEVYSLAIILKEANLLDRSLLYGTDINPLVLEKARKGIFPISQMQQFSKNYVSSGGLNDFSSYYIANYNLAKFNDIFHQKMIFSTHNLVSDSSFNSFQLILCRNVLIYFDKNLQGKVLELFDKSLDMLGFLALGSKETLRFTSIAEKFKPIEGKEKIWRKVR
ncbi:protein-glutamate O-methyltransferase CheR [Panacibacter sp. DH6]|uniref:Protein-glutamate O-methyltransferase CheR n=1 Tax=Panacibacter microcysteis TaxID=2793269 RepID=A0A931E1I1_9BACT|nr:protein-glutamate O-methyltransferase CheR [Panacibacter microcysteis]MBG9375765.1 protein-glutamate O-methyltransferase CheR [Panacibacter microcysteis]